MKQFDDAFLALYEQYETDPVGVDKPMALQYEMVLTKTGIKPRKSRRNLKLLLVAAVLGAGVLTAAAAYTASDAFRGVLDLQDSPSGSSQASQALDRAGVVLGDRQEKSGVQVTLRAAAGDEQTLKILVDIEDQSGNPLALRQPDGSLSRDILQFDQVDLTQNGQYFSGGYGASVIDDDPTDSKSTLLLFFESQEPLNRGSYTLQLEDLMQFAEQNGKRLQMDPDALYELAGQFGGHTEDDFERDGYSADADDNVTYSYSLITDSSESYPLCEDFPDIRVTNAAIRDGIFYLRGTISSWEDWSTISNSPALLNAQTGGSFSWSSAGISDNDDILRWSITFDGVQSPEDLRGFVWAYGEGESLYLLQKGSWRFDFTLDYENTTRSLTPNRAAQWDCYPVTVTSLEVSPFTVFVDYTADRSVLDQMVPPTEWGEYRPWSDWEKSSLPIQLHLADGTILTASYPGRSSGDPDGSADWRLTYALDQVIDPQQVTGVTIGDQTISLPAE